MKSDGRDVFYGYLGKMPGSKKPWIFASDEEYYEMLAESDEDTESNENVENVSKLGG